MLNNSLKIILVDDDDIFANLFERVLKRSKMDYQLTRYKDGLSFTQGLLDLDPHQSHTLFLDLNMSIMNGFQVLDWMKDNGYSDKMTRVIQSSSMLPNEIRKCYDLGCNLYLSKDMTIKEFQQLFRFLAHYQWK